MWQEIIRRILDIPLCKYPLGNKNPHIEEQSYIYIKQITVRLQALSYKEYMYKVNFLQDGHLWDPALSVRLREMSVLQRVK